MPRVTIPAADPVCVMQCPDKSRAVSRRMNDNNNAFRKVSQKDQGNQWPGFLLPFSGAIQKAYTSFFLNNWSQSTGHWAQHSGTALQPSDLACPAQSRARETLRHNEPSERDSRAVVNWCELSPMDLTSRAWALPRASVTVRTKRLLLPFFFSVSKAGETVSPVYGQVWIGSCTD